MPLDRERIESLYTPAALAALAHFPVDATDIKLVAHSENVTFRISEGNGGLDYALRLHRPGYNSIDELVSERTWVAALSESGLRVQNSIRTNDDRYFELIDIPSTGEQRYAGMTTWLDGELLDDYLAACDAQTDRPRMFRMIGEMAATMHNQVSRWEEPPDFTRHRLDLDGLLGDAPVWGRFWENENLTRAERGLLQRAREDAKIALLDYGARQDHFGLIHADLHPNNIVLKGTELGVLDFDDSAYGWHLYDFASALIEYTTASDFEKLQTALLDGYRQYRPLSDRDVDVLPLFLLIRGMAIIGWFHQRPEHAISDYFVEIKNWVISKCDDRRYLG